MNAFLFYIFNVNVLFLGQQLVEELMDAQSPGCPIEFFNIRVPEGHPKFDPNKTGNMEMNFRRSRYDHKSGFSPNNPRKIVGFINRYLQKFVAVKVWHVTHLYD